MNKRATVRCNEFVLRQTPESGFSHFSGSWEDLEAYVSWYMNSDPATIKQGYKDGVILVTIPPIFTNYGYGLKTFKFYSGVVKLNEGSKISAKYAPRRVDEASYIKLGTKAKKCVAKHVEIVLYRADVLRENNEQSTDADWEIICIKARSSDQEEPMDPYTMARNFLHMKGGTKGDFTAEQFAESIVYWNNHVMCLGDASWLSKIKNFFRGLTS